MKRLLKQQKNGFSIKISWRGHPDLTDFKQWIKRLIPLPNDPSGIIMDYIDDRIQNYSQEPSRYDILLADNYHIKVDDTSLKWKYIPKLVLPKWGKIEHTFDGYNPEEWELFVGVGNLCWSVDIGKPSDEAYVIFGYLDQAIMIESPYGKITLPSQGSVSWSRKS